LDKTFKTNGKEKMSYEQHFSKLTKIMLKDHGIHTHLWDIEGNCSICAWSKDQIRDQDDIYFRNNPLEFRKIRDKML